MVRFSSGFWCCQWKLSGQFYPGSFAGNLFLVSKDSRAFSSPLVLWHLAAVCLGRCGHLFIYPDQYSLNPLKCKHTFLQLWKNCFSSVVYFFLSIILFSPSQTPLRSVWKRLDVSSIFFNFFHFLLFHGIWGRKGDK